MSSSGGGDAVCADTNACIVYVSMSVCETHMSMYAYVMCICVYVCMQLFK